MHGARVVLAAGILIGILGDLLFHGARLGLNVPLWLAALVLAGALARRATDTKPALPWATGVLLFFALCLAWRASPFLRAWNVLAVLSAAVAVSVQLRGRIAAAWPEVYLRGAFDLVTHVAGGVVAAAAGLPRRSGRDEASAARRRAIGIGIVLAVPVVLVFGGLLASADPVLDAFVVDLFNWDLGLAFEHTLLILFLSWVAVGWLRTLTALRTAADDAPIPPPRRFGLIEIGVPLGALAVLLAVFIGLQARYLFGGEAVMRLTGLTYAEFARRGFFELVALSALVVPLLYVAQWVLEREARGTVESFRALLVALAGLVGLVMISALVRMRLYVAAYGLTEDRFYATAFIIWIGSVLGWFTVTELRAQPNRFATGAVLAGFAVLAVLNALNPDARIARTNIARARSGLEFDAEYVGRLSVDAVPAVVDGWFDLDPAARCRLGRDLVSRADTEGDWREWHWAGAMARRAAQHLPSLPPCDQDREAVPVIESAVLEPGIGRPISEHLSPIADPASSHVKSITPTG